MSTINKPEAQAKVEAPEIQADAKQPETKPVSAKPAAAKAFDFTYKPVSTRSKAYKIADRVWWKKTADTKLASMIDVDVDKLSAIYESDAYKQSIFNLYCEQRPTLEIFDNYIKVTSNVVYRDAKRLKVDMSTLKQIHEAVRKHHQQIADGAEIKVRARREASDVAFSPIGVVISSKSQGERVR